MVLVAALYSRWGLVVRGHYKPVGDSCELTVLTEHPLSHHSVVFAYPLIFPHELLP